MKRYCQKRELRTLIDWKVVACEQGSSGWQDLLEESDRDRQDSLLVGYTSTLSSIQTLNGGGPS